MQAGIVRCWREGTAALISLDHLREYDIDVAELALDLGAYLGAALVDGVPHYKFTPGD